MARSDVPAIVAEGLRKSFGKTEALAGVDFEVKTGAVLGLLGPNGAGKTTAVRILTTLLRADGGRAEVAGVDVAANPERVRSLIGLAGQNAAVDEILTGKENLVMFGQLYRLSHRSARARADELLDRFNLTDAADRTLKTYSGGMRRRLDLAASLIVSPPVLFLDEPTTGLDPRSRNEMWTVIEDLVDDGTTVLLTTQYLEEADRLADRIVVVDHGKVIAEGTSSELKSQMGGERLAISVPNGTDLNLAEQTLRSIAGRDADREGGIQIDDDANLLTVPFPAGARGLAEAVRKLDAAGLEITDFSLRRPTLDDVFLTLTGHAAEDALNGTTNHHEGEGSMSDQTLQVPVGAVATPRRTNVELETVSRSKPVSVITDSLILARRSLMRIPRQPDWLVGVTLFPIMFLLLFRYIFGNTVQATMPAGENAVNYLVVGVVVQGIGFGGMNTALGLAMDAKEGLMDRFRALPMTRSSVLLGRILADMAIAAFTTTITFGAGLIVGFRPEGSFIEWIYAIGLMLLLAFTLAWIGAIVGMALKSIEAVNSIGFVAIFPLTFISSTFTRVEFLPSWLQGFARNQPFTLVIDSVRGWLTGYPEVGNKGWFAVFWLVVGLVIAVPVATWMYERRAAS